jgi:hypothetical protein
MEAGEQTGNERRQKKRYIEGKNAKIKVKIKDF